MEPEFCQSNLNDTIYHCDDSHCILKSQVCNGIPDCLQAQDEALSECGEKLKIYYFILTKKEKRILV